jgi:ribosome maturation factor RimP
MLLEKKIENVIGEALASRGYEIVRVKYAAKILQIMVEKTGGISVSVGDCEKISKIVSMMLDAEEIISDKYNLEVSSPGLDRPLVKIADFVRFKNKELKLVLINEVDNKRKLRGKIISVKEEGAISILPIDETEEIEIDFANILSANLITKIDFSKK